MHFLFNLTCKTWQEHGANLTWFCKICAVSLHQIPSTCLQQKVNLVGGWATHLKNISQIGSFPQTRLNKKMKPPTSYRHPPFRVCHDNLLQNCQQVSSQHQNSIESYLHRDPGIPTKSLYNQGEQITVTHSQRKFITPKQPPHQAASCSSLTTLSLK